MGEIGAYGISADNVVSGIGAVGARGAAVVTRAMNKLRKALRSAGSNALLRFRHDCESSDPTCSGSIPKINFARACSAVGKRAV